jgi:hypothetical protein
VELFVGEKCSDKFRLQFDFHVIVEIFYMPQICDMGQTALLPLRRKACWGFFSPLKIRRLRPGLKPRTWVPKASTLPLDHRSRFRHIYGPIILYDTKDTELCCILLVTRKGLKTQYIILRLCVCLLIADEISRRDVVDILYVSVMALGDTTLMCCSVDSFHYQ